METLTKPTFQDAAMHEGQFSPSPKDNPINTESLSTKKLESWNDFFDDPTQVTADFMVTREDLPPEDINYLVDTY